MYVLFLFWKKNSNFKISCNCLNTIHTNHSITYANAYGGAVYIGYKKKANDILLSFWKWQNEFKIFFLFYFCSFNRNIKTSSTIIKNEIKLLKIKKKEKTFVQMHMFFFSKRCNGTQLTRPLPSMWRWSEENI